MNIEYGILNILLAKSLGSKMWEYKQQNRIEKERGLTCEKGPVGWKWIWLSNNIRVNLNNFQFCVKENYYYFYVNNKLA